MNTNSEFVTPVPLDKVSIVLDTESMAIGDDTAKNAAALLLLQPHSPVALCVGLFFWRLFRAQGAVVL